MKTTFTIKNICPFDLLRWDKDAFYNLLDQEYFDQFDKQIEIIEADMSFVKRGIKVKLITFKIDGFTITVKTN